MKHKLKWNKLLVLGLLFSCKGKDEDTKIVEPLKSEPASCLLLNVAGVNPAVDPNVDNKRAFVQSCFESEEQLSLKWCEDNASHFDTDKRFYRLNKGDRRCPTEAAAGKCVYPAENGKEGTTVWFYKNPDIDTDFDLVRRGCNAEGMYFDLT